VTTLLKYANFEQLQRRCLQDLPLIKTLLEYLLVIVLGSFFSKKKLFEAPDQGSAPPFLFFSQTSFDLPQDTRYTLAAFHFLRLLDFFFYLFDRFNIKKSGNIFPLLFFPFFVI